MIPETDGRVQTVLGLILGDQLGMTDAHTHVIRDGGVLTEADPDFLLDSVALAASELRLFHAAGGRAVVDMMPAAPGRNVRLLAEVSSQTGVHIIAATGFVAWALPAESPIWNLPEAELAQILAAEIQKGVAAEDESSSTIDRTPIRAGVIKISVELENPSPPERKFLSAAARAHLTTGAPIVVHTASGSGALLLVNLLQSLGVPASAVLLSHCFHARNSSLLERLAETGAFLVADGAGKPHHDEARLINDLLNLAKAGHGDRLLLGFDGSRRKYWRSYGGGPGFDYVPMHVTGKLRDRGFTDANLEQILIHNPARALALRRPSGVP